MSTLKRTPVAGVDSSGPCRTGSGWMGVPVSGKELRETGLLGVPGGAHADALEREHGVQCSLSIMGTIDSFLRVLKWRGGESVASPRHGLRALTLSSACPIPGSGRDSNCRIKGADDVHSTVYENGGKPTGRYLGQIERNFNNIFIEFRKQRFCLYSIVGILRMGLVGQDGMKKIFGNIQSFTFHSSGAGPQGTCCSHRFHIHSKPCYRG